MSLRRVAAFLKSCLPSDPRVSGTQIPRSTRRFRVNERGSVAIYFGLSAIVFVGVAGLAVDAARGYLIKARLSEAVDAAALAGGKALVNDTDLNHTVVTNDVIAFFNANFPNGAMGANVVLDTPIVDGNSTSVTVSANARIPTTLMRLLGYNNMLMTASAQVARAATGLDVVLSFDNSGSMGDTISGESQTKIQQQRSNAQDLVDLLAKPFTSGLQQQLITVQGTQYSLLNIGVVPWNSKVNVRTYNVSTNSTPTGNGTVTKGAAYAADPMQRYSGSQNVYTSSNSEVPLLYDPSDSTMTPGGWSGCVYARYNGLDPKADIDLTLKRDDPDNTWPGWEPVSQSQGDTTNCYEAAWNDNNNFSAGHPIPPKWYKLTKPPRPNDQQHNDGCSDCPKVGILPLQSDVGEVKTMIGKLSEGGTTNAAQGLFWAWEVLMPGVPYDEAVVSPPFPRAQAIVFMTDGQSHGGNGDAYHGWFGEGDQSSDASDFGKMNLPVYDATCGLSNSLVDNNLGNRLLAVATKIKGCDTTKGGPGQGPVKIYVIQYQSPTDTGAAALNTLLSKVATKPASPYFFQAASGADLQAAFTQIGASLSALRLVQ